jgi:hypothetical protein
MAIIALLGQALYISGALGMFTDAQISAIFGHGLAHLNEPRPVTILRVFVSVQLRLAVVLIRPVGGDWLSGKPPSLLENSKRLTVPGVNTKSCNAYAKVKGTISAESAAQQNPGREPWERSDDTMEPCKGEAARAALTGLILLDCISQGSRPGLCCLALSGPFMKAPPRAAHDNRFERLTFFRPPALPEVSDVEVLIRLAEWEKG